MNRDVKLDMIVFGSSIASALMFLYSNKIIGGGMIIGSLFFSLFKREIWTEITKTTGENKNEKNNKN